ncbi:MAG: ribosome maturation factor RimM [Myxococcota bacterium]
MAPDSPKTKSNSPPDDVVILGRVNGVFGIRGEVRLFLYNPGSALLRKEQDVVLRHDGATRTVRLKSRPGAGKRILGRIHGVTTPEQARALVGADILFKKADLPPLEEDTFYHHQILGLPVQTPSGELLGHLREIFSSGDVDIWLVRSRDQEFYIPAIEDEIIAVYPGELIVVSDGDADDIDADDIDGEE